MKEINNKKKSSYSKHYTKFGIFVGLFLVLFTGLGYAGTMSDTSLTQFLSTVGFSFNNDVDMNDNNLVDVGTVSGSALTLGSDLDAGGNAISDMSNIEINGANLYLLTDSYVYVCSSGCDYTTIQDAIDDTPKILKANKRIYIKNGVYNEDIYISGFSCERSSTNEGSTVCLRIIGNETNKNNVVVNSFQIAATTGAQAVEIQDLTINKIEPTSDENASVTVYGGQLTMREINFNATANYAILSYTADVSLTNSTINGNYKHLGYAKKMGNLRLGNTNDPISGSVTEELVLGLDGTQIHIEANNVTYVGNLYHSYQNGLLITQTSTGNKPKIYNLDFATDLDIDGSLTTNKFGVGSSTAPNSIIAASVNGFNGGAAIVLDIDYNSTMSPLRIRDSGASTLLEIDETGETYFYGNVGLGGNPLLKFDIHDDGGANPAQRIQSQTSGEALAVYPNNKICYDGITCAVYTMYNGSCVVANHGAGEVCIS